jgi:hypothetical protein
MATEGNSNTLLLVVVVGLVIYFLISKTQKAVASVNQSVRQTYTGGTAAAAVATSLAPALGAFLSQEVKGLSSPSSSSSSSGYYTSSDSGGYGDGLLSPSFADNSGSSAFSDDSFSELA